MKTAEMRKVLKDAGQKVPRNNPDVEKAYQEWKISSAIVVDTDETTRDVVIEGLDIDGKPIKETIKLVSSNVYTYVGMGDEPPHKIKFMGVQWFTRGLPTEVDQSILEKVSKHACFRKGKVNMDEFYEKDVEEKKKADRQREEDLKLQIEIERVNRKA